MTRANSRFSKFGNAPRMSTVSPNTPHILMDLKNRQQSFDLRDFTDCFF
jgi:hypothetical protein